MISAVARTGLVFAAAFGLLGLTMLPGSAKTRKLGDGLKFEGAGASFIDSGQTTTSAFWANQQPTASHGQQSSWPVWIRLRLEVRAAAIV